MMTIGGAAVAGPAGVVEDDVTAELKSSAGLKHYEMCSPVKPLIPSNVL